MSKRRSVRFRTVRFRTVRSLFAGIARMQLVESEQPKLRAFAARRRWQAARSHVAALPMRS